jgi:competence protein ComEC
LRLDIDARFLPFAIIIWAVSLLTITGKQVFVALFVVVVLILIYFKKLKIIQLFVIFVAFLSAFSRTTNTQIPNLTQGIPVIMEVKVISDLNKKVGRNIGIYREEDSNFVIAKSIRFEEVGVKEPRRINYKSKIKIELGKFDDKVEFGTKLIVKGKISAYNFQNIAYSLQVEEYSILKEANLFDKAINKVRSNFLEITTSLSGDARELLPGLILGDTRNQSLSLSQDMKNSGLTHLTAVSGGNIAILLLAIIWLGQKLRFTIKKQIVTGLFTLIIFALLVRTEPSVVRASLMGAISLLGLFTGTRRHGISALVTTICVALLLDPNLAVSWGFCLSVFATAGLLVFTRPFANKISELVPRIPESLSVLIAVALSAQISTVGLIAGFSGQITLWSIPANLLASPVIPFVTILGYLSLVFSNFYTPFAYIFGYLASIFANWIGFLAHYFASQDSSIVHVPKGIIGFLLISFIMALSASLFFLIAKTKIEHKRTLSISLFLILICLVVLKTKEPKNWPITDWQFVMCDVGQGDGLVLRDSTGKVLVVDVGPNGQLMNDCLKKLGVKTIDVLMLTHFHADHVEGLELVKNRHKINKVYLTWVEDPIYEVERTRQLLNGIQTSHITSGEVISLGEMKIQCLWPTRIKMNLSSIPNNASLVNLVTIKNASFLLTGDIEPPAQEAIQKLWKIPHVDVVKVPHHGSKFQDANFPKWTRARLALISVGQENSYGHPAKLTLDLYRDSGMQVLSTDEVGSIAIGISADDSIRVSTKD